MKCFVLIFINGVMIIIIIITITTQIHHHHHHHQQCRLKSVVALSCARKDESLGGAREWPRDGNLDDGERKA